jgi:hypothetical protein
MRFVELVPVVQMAIGPVILISGVGLLLLSMTNRFGRVIDRVRQIAATQRHGAAVEKERLSAQLRMLRRRAALLRVAITLGVLSVLMAALLVITVFVTAAARSDFGLPVVIFFVASMALLIASLLVFLQDLNLSLEAMNIEISDQAEDG